MSLVVSMSTGSGLAVVQVDSAIDLNSRETASSKGGEI
jgi:hypothetical protein